MSSGTINKVILIGNLGMDPEIRTMQNGKEMASFSIIFSAILSAFSTLINALAWPIDNFFSLIIVFTLPGSDYIRIILVM